MNQMVLKRVPRTRCPRQCSGDIRVLVLGPSNRIFRAVVATRLAKRSFDVRHEVRPWHKLSEPSAHNEGTNA